MEIIYANYNGVVMIVAAAAMVVVWLLRPILVYMPNAFIQSFSERLAFVKPKLKIDDNDTKTMNSPVTQTKNE